MKSIYKKSIVGAVLIIGVLATMFTVHIVFNPKKPSDKTWKHSFSPERRRPATLEDIARIAPWMTFDYLNKVYNLPGNYLQDALKVTDVKYPFLTIKQYALKTNTTTTELINTLQTIIKEQLKTKSSQ